MNLLEQLKSVSTDFVRLEEFPIDFSGKTVGWNCNSIDIAGHVIAGGTDEDRLLSRIIAIAETFERVLIKKFCEDSILEKKFLLNKYKSSAGFAVGFDKKTSLEHALFEAIERHVLQQWTDGLITLQAQEFVLENKLTQSLAARFDRIQFVKRIIVTEIQSLEISLSLVVCIAFKDEGIFWGSKVHYSDNKCVQHSLIEAYRNLNIFNERNQSKTSERTYVDDVICHYGSGAGSLKRIFISNELQSVLTVKDFELIETMKIFDQVFLSRVIAAGYSENYSEDYKMRFW